MNLLHGTAEGLLRLPGTNSPQQRLSFNHQGYISTHFAAVDARLMAGGQVLVQSCSTSGRDVPVSFHTMKVHAPPPHCMGVPLSPPTPNNFELLNYSASSAHAAAPVLSADLPDATPRSERRAPTCDQIPPSTGLHSTSFPRFSPISKTRAASQLHSKRTLRELPPSRIQPESALSAMHQTRTAWDSSHTSTTKISRLPCTGLRESCTSM